MGITLLLTGLLPNLLPAPPALDPAERAAFDTIAPSGAVYTGPAREPYAVIPIQVWGLRYALDVVIESQHPDWIMHEYARIDLPGGPLWIAKDASPDFVQTITAPVDDIETWLPEVPVPRVHGPVDVVDRSVGDTADLHLAYTNPKGDAVDLSYVGGMPTKPASKRNGNTMGHSQQSLAALLDLHLFRPGGKVHLSIGGREWPMRRLFGLYPMKFLLAQTQGGIAIADYRQTAGAAPGSFQLRRPGEDIPWPTHAEEVWTESDGWARRPGPVVSLSYHFQDGELDRAQAWQVGVSAPVTNLTFTPALPDVRRPFVGEIVSRFAADIAGQAGHGTGTVHTRWVDADTVRLEIRPTAPPWFASRPIDVTIRHEADGVRVQAVRVPSTP